jgi:hypothetical protein
MFLVRILTMKRQLDLLDQQLERLRRLTGRQA